MRVGTQGLFRLCLKTFVAPFLPARLTAPGSPRMNERGFALFLQNLKSVLNLLASADELETDVLIQTRSRLVDASGTLSFLLNDMSNGLTNATGIPSNAIQVPVQHLKNSLTHITDLLSSRIEGRNNVDFYDSLDMSYSCTAGSFTDRTRS